MDKLLPAIIASPEAGTQAMDAIRKIDKDKHMLLPEDKNLIPDFLTKTSSIFAQNAPPETQDLIKDTMNKVADMFKSSKTVGDFVENCDNMGKQLAKEAQNQFDNDIMMKIMKIVMKIMTITKII